MQWTGARLFFVVDIFKPQWIIFGRELSLIVKWSAARTSSGSRNAFLLNVILPHEKKHQFPPFFGHFLSFSFRPFHHISFNLKMFFLVKKIYAKARCYIVHKEYFLSLIIFFPFLNVSFFFFFLSFFLPFFRVISNSYQSFLTRPTQA